MTYTTEFIECFGQQIAVTKYEPDFEEWLRHEIKMERSAEEENLFFQLADREGIEIDDDEVIPFADEWDFIEDPETYQELLAYTGTEF